MNFERLQEILTYKRPHGGPTEFKFYNRFILPYEPVVFHDKNEIFAYVVTVVNGDSPLTTLFSCHVDTVHHDDGFQVPVYDADLAMFFKDDKQCLGADDGAGVWLMLEMIDAGVPGNYIFHRGEERGGIGSSGMARVHDKFIKQHQHAVAFDRRGTCSVITHQSRGRCCSDAFAKDLAERLSAKTGYEIKPDDTGVFTDTANYGVHVPECTNISVGYECEHTSNEILDAGYIIALREACIDPSTWAGMTVERTPGEEDWRGRWGRHRSWSSNDDWDFDWVRDADGHWVQKNAFSLESSEDQLKRTKKKADKKFKKNKAKVIDINANRDTRSNMTVEDADGLMNAERFERTIERIHAEAELDAQEQMEADAAEEEMAWDFADQVDEAVDEFFYTLNNFCMDHAYQMLDDGSVFDVAYGDLEMFKLFNQMLADGNTTEVEIIKCMGDEQAMTDELERQGWLEAADRGFVH